MHLPDNFLEGEERDGYYVSPEMKELWAVELDLLNEFIRVCKKHNLKYYADGGTILGAVRHRGFIPWDDDIDITMFREDYEKLCQVAQEEFQYPYFYQTEFTDPGALRSHAQLRNSLTTGILTKDLDKDFKFNQGIFLDIFVLDNVPDDEIMFNKQLKWATKYKRKAYSLALFTHRYNEKNLKGVSGIWKKIKYVVWKHFFSHKNKVNKYYLKFEKEVKRYEKFDTKRVAKYFSLPMDKSKMVWKKEWYSSTIEMPFEMLRLPVPAGYESILEQFYGNWKEYKIEATTHGGITFDTNISYKDYLLKKDEQVVL